MNTRRLHLLAVLGTTALLAPTAGAAGAVASASPMAASIRVDQVGYLPHETKHAYLMAAAQVSGETFDVVDSSGHPWAHGNLSAQNRGPWSATYRAVHDITFTGLTRPGRYHILVRGAVTAVSTEFSIEQASAMSGRLVVDGVKFDQVQRDGRHVLPGPLHREPAHLNDQRATVYAWPHFRAGSDTITDVDLTRIRGPVDVAGGWSDAGDYLKFTHTSAYNDVVLYAAERGLGRTAPASLDAEAHHGSDWLSKMWDERSKTLYLQVGIGSGNEQGTFVGDHDRWRLPQADDQDTAPADRYIAHRPVFEATAPAHPISPNLVGRVSAAFALAAQVDASHHRFAQARREFAEATSLYAMADTTTPPKTLTTALPNAFYPESTWHDDMELGATEIALAARSLHLSSSRYLRDAARWARAYIAHDTGDTFNLYDTSALAHVDLTRAIRLAGNPAGLDVSGVSLTNDLRRQLGTAAARAENDPFRVAGNYDTFDVDSHVLGLVATAGWYRAVTGDRRFDAFATAQRDWVFGANPWGMSFMVGEGTVFPHCMQHQVANLSGTVDGRPPLDVGAVVNGPNGKDAFDPGGLGGYQAGMVSCPANGLNSFARFDGRGSRYVDDVRAWETDEPALDMTAAAIAAAAASLGPS